MKSALWIIVILLAGCSRPTESEPIWIGHLVPLSGPNREQGEDAVRAVELQIEKAKAAGRNVAVRHVDAGNKATSRAEAVRLLAVNKVVALLVGPGVENADEVAAAARAHDAAVVVLDNGSEWYRTTLVKFLKAKTKGKGENDPPYTPMIYPAGEHMPSAAKEWSAEYEKRFSRPPSEAALMGHDGLAILLAASLVDGQPSLAKVKSFEGLTGEMKLVDGKWRWPLFAVRAKGEKNEAVEKIPVPEG